MTEAEVAARAQELEGQAPEEILRWAFAAFPRIAISTAFGPEGCALVAMAAAIKPDVKVFTVDTDFLFPESLELRAKFVERYGLNLEVLKGAVTLEEQNRRHGLALYERDTDTCCALRKVEPTRRALVGLDAWIAGLRRDQAKTRARIDVLESYQRDDGTQLVKVNPLARWTRKDTWDYLLGHDVPYNPLLDRGYKSIGCWPCTQPVAADADERAGRWGGQKLECGIHTFMARKA
ncbi:MAG TPA: phosphoadenylyl-sulfate reductase [Polyangia bacterium]|nr:phosphoadenylyl-sulfate reductase [Polyangia bacterium]